MRRFVLDASVTLAWFVDPVVAPVAVRVRQFLFRGDRAIVPHLWRSEIANGFLIAQKRGILAGVRVLEAFSELDRFMGQSVDNFDRDFPIRQIVAAAQNFGLTAYDATYLETARELQVPLATLDRTLVTAAAQAGVTVIS